MPVPLPPLAEQERIVAAIEEQFSRLDAGVAALERVRQNLKRMRAAVLKPPSPDDSPVEQWPSIRLATLGKRRSPCGGPGHPSDVRRLACVSSRGRSSPDGERRCTQDSLTRGRPTIHALDRVR